MRHDTLHSARLLLLAAALSVAGGLAGPARAQAPEVDAARAEYMIKNTLVAINHANITGNYTVLRDLGSLRFRANNTAARLAEVFAPLRNEGIDLAPIVLFEPQFAAPIDFDEMGRLRFVGQFPTRPLRVLFDLAFESSGNRWALSDVAVNSVPWPEDEEDQGDREDQGDEGDREDQEEQGSMQPQQPTAELPRPRPRPVQ